MASSVSVDEPQVLFTLPRNLEEDPSNIKAAPVYRLRRGRRLLRQELVVGVNGDAINLYNVAEPRIITSHAIPPLSTLSVAPCCIYTTRGRFVYCAAQKAGGGAKSTLLGFRQPRTSRNNSEPAEKHQCDLDSHHGPVVHMEAFGDESLETSSLLVIQEDGHATILQDDLSTKQWEGQLELPGTSASLVSYACSCSAAEAVEGVFKSRQDILATAKAFSATSSDGAPVAARVVFLMSWDTEHRINRVDAYMLRPSLATTSSRTPLQHVCSWHLQDFSSKHIQYHFNPRSGTLQALGKHRLFAFKLTSVAAKRTLQLDLRVTGRSTFISIAPNLSVVVSKNGCEVYDVVFGSIQAVQTSLPFAGAMSTNRKRKRQSAEFGFPPTKLIHYYPRLGSLVGFIGNDLISYSIKLDKAQRNVQSADSSRLLDAIDKGINSYKSVDLDMEDETTKSLFSYAEKRDVVQFEKLFFQATADEREAKSIDLVKHDAGAMQASSMKAARHGGIEMGLDVRARQLARVAMSSIFVREVTSLEANNNQFGPTNLRVRFFPSNVFRWLSLYQLLTPDHIGRALKSRTSNAGLVTSITQEAVVAAIANADPSLVMLADVVIKGNVTSHTGLIRAVRILLRSFDKVPDFQESSQPRLALQHGQNPDESEASDEDNVVTETRAAEWELDMASILLEDGPSGRGLALRTCCEKLVGSASAKQVARCLREQMSRRDLTLLIDLLRYELHSGGWTSHFTGRTDVDHDHPQDEVIWVICELLNRVLDALGTGGWIATLPTSHDDQTQEVDEHRLIEELRADVFSTLEGVQESNFFCGFLRDFLRYKDTLQSAGPRRAGRDGEIESDFTRGEEQMLPLGLESAKGVSGTRIGAGGEVLTRSRRDLAHKLDKRVPVYSFERIHV